MSRPLDETAAEDEQLARDAVTKATLLAQNDNSSWRDITKRRPLFAQPGAVGAADGVGRVRVTSRPPKDLRPETIDAMVETPEVCEQLHLPLQSGSDAVLRAMRRGYTAERYLERLTDRRRAIDDLAVTTDIIGGSRARRTQTLKKTRRRAEAGIRAHIRSSSRRDRTRGRPRCNPTSFPPRPSPSVSSASRQWWTGPPWHDIRRASALRRGVGRRDEPAGRHHAQGTTRQGKLVHFAAGTSAGNPKPGALARVIVTDGHRITCPVTSRR